MIESIIIFVLMLVSIILQTRKQIFWGCNFGAAAWGYWGVYHPQFDGFFVIMLVHFIINLLGIFGHCPYLRNAPLPPPDEHEDNPV